MGWDNINGDAKIIPTAGNTNEVIFETGKPVKLIMLLKPGEEPYSYLEHAIENETVENGKTVRKFRTVRCPQTPTNPSAPCPLCDAQRFKRRARSVCNVYNIDTGKIEKLNQGDSVWKAIGAARKMGMDVTSVVWGVVKSGEGRNNTTYTTTNLGPISSVCPNFKMPDDSELFDIQEDYKPGTEDDMRAACEAVGVTWEFACTPPELVFPKTLQDALDHVMPNGKYKNQTFAQMWNADKSNRGMISFLATKSNRISDEKACAQVILANLGGANIPGVPKYSQNGTIDASSIPAHVASTTSVPAATQTTSQQATTTVAVPTDGKQAKINQINKLLAGDKFVKGGFAMVMNMMKKCGNGKTNISDFTDAELDTMLTACK